MSLLKNASQSIRLGFEDFESEDDERLLSAARNLHAGLLLLYKEKLRRLSPNGSDEILLKQQIEPALDSAGVLTFVGKGRKTVDTQKIKERFKSLGISADWKTLDEVTRIRNDIEHYYTTTGKDTMRGVISKSFILFRDFARGELSEDPRSLLGEEIWLAMIEISDVYDRERAECVTAIKSFEWTAPALREAVLATSCKACGSTLIEPKNDTARSDVECRSCGEIQTFEGFAEHALSEGIDHHYNYLDGGDAIVVMCPSCGLDTYHYESGKCLACDESAIQQCIACSNNIPAEELNERGICGYCDHKFSKDD